MKKILLSVLLLAGISLQAAVYSTNLTAGGTFLLLSGRANVYSMELTSGNSCAVDFFDCDSVAAPFYGTNYTNASFVSKTTYATNITSSYVGYNGYTNWYTNTGIYTLSVTNAAATNNALPKMLSGVVAGNTYVVYNTDALFTRGICVSATTNVSLVINYRTP